MNNSKSTKTTFLNTIWSSSILTGALLLSACGGGGGGDASSSSESNQPVNLDDTPVAQETRSYAPDAQRLLEAAEDSGALYVEEDFSFDHAQMTELQVSVTDMSGATLAGASLSVYVIDTRDMDETPETWSDELIPSRQLIASGISNANGVFKRALDFPRLNDKKPLLLIEVNAIGIETKQLVSVEGSTTAVLVGLI